MLDQIHLVSIETASKDIQLVFNLLLNVIQSKELKTQIFKDTWLVYLTTGTKAGIWIKYLRMYLDYSNCK